MLRDYEAVLKAAADPSRARILKMLERGELCVCQMVAVLGLCQSTVSKHLSLLRAAGLVEERKNGRWVYFRLGDSAVNPYAQNMLALLHGWLKRDALIRDDAEKLARIRKVAVDQLCAAGAQLAPPAASTTRGRGGRG